MNSRERLFKRMALSAQDFVRGVQPVIEELLGIKVYPIENVDNSELFQLFDKNGIDAFYFDEGRRPRGLASRMNYHSAAARKPCFTFRYGLWDYRSNSWNSNREFVRLCEAVSRPEEHIILPKLHVESFSRAKGSGSIGWSFAADTRTLMRYIHANFADHKKVRIFEPKSGEKRSVISVCVETYAREFPVIPVAEIKKKRANFC